MSEGFHPDPNDLSKDQLIEQSLILQDQLNSIRLQRSSIWSLLVDISRRLQITSTSIKVAVTSMLDHDIFWDPSVQHEFLQTIDQSVDNVSNLAMMISLASRIQVDKLILKCEPHLLQEILSVLEDEIRDRLKNILVKVTFPLEGKPVFVDYEYLMIALRFLFEVIAATEKLDYTLEVVANEKNEHWLLEIHNIPPSIYKLVCDTVNNISQEYIRSEHISAEKALMVYNAYHILRLQEIDLRACKNVIGNDVLYFTIRINS